MRRASTEAHAGHRAGIQSHRTGTGQASTESREGLGLPGVSGPTKRELALPERPCPTSRRSPGCAGGQDGQGRGCQRGRDQTTEGVKGARTPDTTVLPQTQPSRGLEGGACIGARRVRQGRWGRTGGGSSVEGVHLSAAQQVPGQEPQSGQGWADAAVCPGRCGAPSVCLSVPRWIPESCRCWPARQLPGNLCPTKKTLTETQPSRRPGLIRPHGVLSPAPRAKPA